MSRGESGANGDEAAIRALLGGLDPAAAEAHASLAQGAAPQLAFDPRTGPGSTGRRHRWSFRARVAAVAVPALLAGAGGVAVAWGDWGSGPESTEAVRCYADADVALGEHFHGAYVRRDKPADTPAQVLGACGDLWTAGHFARHAGLPAYAVRSPAPADPQPASTVPPLITCLVDGYVSAIPAFAGETCDSLHLRTWPFT